MINNKFDEGLGTVYERFMLNNYFDGLIEAHQPREILEVPIYGMTGLTGINSVRFVERGCHVTLVDQKKENVDEASALWKILPHDVGMYEIVCHEDLSRLPFGDGKFDLVWNFAAMWHVQEPESLLSEMARVSSNLVLIFMPNVKQIGFQLRKYVLDRNFFKTIDEKWARMEMIRSFLEPKGFSLKAQGVLDVPPWPDTCLPIGPFLRKIGMNANGSKERWTWDIMRYYLGNDRGLKDKVERYSFLETMHVPWRLKALWAHHRYVIFSKNQQERDTI